jgi:hypothetical protein
MSYTKTRIIQSDGYMGKWVVQGWWPDTQVWADIGDPCDTAKDAEAKLAKIQAENSGDTDQ